MLCVVWGQVRIQAGVNDEQVVKIYDTITVEEKEMFIVMEYCEGGNLLQWIKRSRRHKLLNQTVGHTFESDIIILYSVTGDTADVVWDLPGSLQLPREEDHSQRHQTRKHPPGQQEKNQTR